MVPSHLNSGTKSGTIVPKHSVLRYSIGVFGLRGDRMSQRDVWVFCDCPGCPHSADVSDVDGMNLCRQRRRYASVEQVSRGTRRCQRHQ